MLIKLSDLVKKYNMQITGVSHFGAHLGQEVLTYKELSIRNIHLFEPQKDIFNDLVKKFSNDNDVNLYNIGLGSENKTTNINLSPGNDGQSASILDPEKHKAFYPDIEFYGKEQIELRIYDDLAIEGVNFFNIDIQGYELHALNGSLETLRNDIEYIFIEVSRKELYEGSALVQDLDKFLEKLNFIRVETKWVSYRIPWGDALYIKRDKASRVSISLLKLRKFIERYALYYLITDLIRKLKKLKYKLKQTIKGLITKR